MLRYGNILPTSQVAYTSSTVSFTCYSNIAPKWSKNRKKIRRGHTFKSRSQILLLYKVAEADTGVYECRGSLSFNNPFVAFAHLYVASEWFTTMQMYNFHKKYLCFYCF